MGTLLRLATAGSVDDGKSTLIGRLLHDAKGVCIDQLASVERTSRERGQDRTDLALLTDGLRAEREQGITIDVAYRYFATPRRKFIVADTPGHPQYTRNMVTGASTADLAIVLVDARNGLVEQSRRHAFLSSLLGIRHVVLAVNKMDLVGWDADRFDAIREDFHGFAARLDFQDVTAIPLSALHGDNVVTPSAHSPWYPGPPLLRHLEEVYVASDRNLVDVRLPVQYVIRQPDRRAYAGTLGSGVLRPGDQVTVLPAGHTTTVTGIEGPKGPLAEAFAPMAVSVTLAEELDVGRGDMLARPHNQPKISHELDAMVCWMADDSPLREGAEYLVKHTTASTKARVLELDYRLDVNSLRGDRAARSLDRNDIGRVRLRTRAPLLTDDYRRNPATGSFILIDRATNHTVGAGMLLPQSREEHRNISRHSSLVEARQRLSRGVTLWFTGLSGSGKSSLAVLAEQRLLAAGRPAFVLDGDNLRHGLNSDLGFSMADRAENLRRIAHVACLLTEAGMVTLVPTISPLAEHRDMARALHTGQGLEFREVFVDTPLSVCEERDPKGLYAKARAGQIPDFTGIGSPYEAPGRPDLRLSHPHTPDELVDRLLGTLER
ncbi:sulfate adenylyltransferase subunit CysN [Pseudonocardia eucalypti]|uniref:Adenylyl-sulfate kinase n=1 Tax=Pseudonocardia eucalypti TaxID=648755 RepID=A0ABP9QM96_9PSEU|nr:bifunctional enzyme CysN/CysC [Pseudonocardia eucalypti]